VFEKSRCGQPLALFSGDFIFVGSLGRPDLLGEAEKRSLAAALYDSVHTKI
jgi:hydroxyacylglutathione hydrolase